MKPITAKLTEHRLKQHLGKLIVAAIATPLVCGATMMPNSDPITENHHRQPNLELLAIAPDSPPTLAHSHNTDLNQENPWKLAWWLTGSLTAWVVVETFVVKKSSFSDYFQVNWPSQKFLDQITKLWDQTKSICQQIPERITHQQRIKELETEILYYQEQLKQETNQQQTRLAALISHLELTTAELEQVKQQAKAFEQYVITENEQLTTENQELQDNLNTAKAQIYYLQHSLDESRKGLALASNFNETEPFLLAFSKEARDQLTLLSQTDGRKYQKIFKTLNLMSSNLRHPSLQTHEYNSLSGPNGEKIFESYIENNNPSAWRIFWYYGPGKQFLTIYNITPHP
jgi:DNA repair exonuclease SbcCD ATPase subunit